MGSHPEDAVSTDVSRRNEEEASEARRELEELKEINSRQARKIDELIEQNEKLERSLKHKSDEMEAVLETHGSMGLLLRDMDSIAVQTLEQEDQMRKMKQRSETLEKRLKNKYAQLEEMDAQLTDVKAEHEKKTGLLSMRVDILNKDIEDKASALSEAEASLCEATEQLEKRKTKLDELKMTLLDSTARYDEQVD
eukprot:CAMPEP_0183316512 /NCGR_PEP_ID=MMETSP0160_2-20130417/55180_1 /TAXON_ID=2839 ORGANISM="Odontella Sinensis, Strain Grunow 1884" /NCGR_SAMPLE_ID=MMETSP0160_2 /ASSEMBLY_ACC=CAM_ASM_000250 /LENGTH=194 /DNA_ID=CAMNT_0025482325 /DNA_START=32 /DNA_END=613 /DNA_ORIENTATION=-